MSTDVLQSLSFSERLLTSLLCFEHLHDNSGPGQSKGGRGAHAFGSEGQEAQDAEKDPASAEPATDAVDEGEDAAPAEPVVEAEPEPPTMTMEEFLAQRAAARANTQLFGETKPVRKVETDLSGARRGKEELGNWGGFGMNKDEGEKQKEQRSHAKTQILDVAFKNAALEAGRDRDDRDEGRGGRGRGGRGDGRDGGRGGRGGRGPTDRRDAPRPSGNGGRGGGSRIDLSDANAFPSL
jgi:hypothetical protein